MVVAIGECGLDYHYDHSPRARSSGRPSPGRSSWPTATAWPWSSTPGRPGTTPSTSWRAGGVPERTVVHCFTGGPDEARRCLDLGASLSFSGVVTFKNAADVREAAALCPLDRLLVETDTPFLAPVPHRGTLNEPSRVPLVGAAVAQVKGVETSALAAASTANARAFSASEVGLLHLVTRCTTGTPGGGAGRPGLIRRSPSRLTSAVRPRV